MQLVRQKEKRAKKRRRTGTVALAALLGAALASGCGQGSPDTDHHPRRGAEGGRVQSWVVGPGLGDGRAAT
ncbi:polysaccharide deacetylase family protein, partial [Streptomyces sp. NPDC002690]